MADVTGASAPSEDPVATMLLADPTGASAPSEDPVATMADPTGASHADSEGPVYALQCELAELRTSHQLQLDAIMERICTMDGKHVETSRKLRALSAENDGLKEKIFALDCKEVAAADVSADVGILFTLDETKALERSGSSISKTLEKHRSSISSTFMAFDEDTEETEEWELAGSMWDACLFLGCKDETGLKGSSMNVGAAVTIFGVLALLINALIQSAIVAVVVVKMANNPDIDDGTAADMRCDSCRLPNNGPSGGTMDGTPPPDGALRRQMPPAGRTARTSGTTLVTWIRTRTCPSRHACATTWRASSSRFKRTSSRTSSTTRTAI
jgi:hypothetical protein